MQPVPPFWFKQRQAKAEPVGENTYRLTAPQQEEAYISIRETGNQRWSASLRRTADGPDLAVTEPEFTTPGDAWEAAFELYRQHLIT